MFIICCCAPKWKHESIGAQSKSPAEQLFFNYRHFLPRNILTQGFDIQQQVEVRQVGSDVHVSSSLPLPNPFWL